MAGALSLVELAANDDVEGMKVLLEGGKASLKATEPWYCRRICSTKMSLLERTPLMVACLLGSTRVVAFILERVSTAPNSPSGGAAASPALAQQSGAKHDPIDINFRSPSDGSTALHCAVTGGSSKASEIAAALLRHGAARDLGDFNGRVPLEAIAVSPKLPHVKTALERLLKAGSEVATAPHVALPCSPELTPPDAPSSPSSPDRDSPFTAPSSPSNSDNSGNKEFGVGDPKYPQDASLPDIKNSLYASDDFRMYSFKIRPCSRAYSHDWTECPFVHPGENARRRDPRRFNYSCVPCPDFRKGACRRGDTCEYAHGVFECWLHPTQYRTRLCKEGTSCERRVCFFAHTPEELRPLQVPSGAGGAGGIMSPRVPGVGDMLSVTFSPDIPPPSPSTVILTGRPSSASGSATPPISSPNGSGMWLNGAREGARSPHTPGDGSPARGAMASPPRGASGDLGKAAAAGLNLSRLRAALVGRDRGIPDEKEAAETAALQQQLTANMQAALLADLYSKLSMSNAAAAAAVQQSPVAIAAALQQQLQVQQQFQAQQHLLQLQAQHTKLAAALAANAAAAGSNEALSALLHGAGGSGNYRGAVGPNSPGAATRLPPQPPPAGASRLSLSSEDSTGLVPGGGGYDSPVHLPSRSFSGPLNLASTRVTPNVYPPGAQGMAQIPPLKLDAASGPGSAGENNKGAFGAPVKPAGVLNVAAPPFNSPSFSPQVQAEGALVQGSLSASGGGVSGASTDSLVLPDDLNTWGPPLGAPDWSSSSAACLVPAGLRSSTVVDRKSPAMSAGATRFRSSSLAEQDLDEIWMQDMGPISHQGFVRDL